MSSRKSNNATSALNTGIRRVVLWVPDWPTNALVVDTPPGAPAATAQGGRVVTTTQAARNAGVRHRMRLTTAQYLCPDLIVLDHDPLREAAAFEQVAGVFDQVAAHVECVRPGLAWAPAAGPARWVGSEGELAGMLVESVVAETGADCQVGIASGLLAACAAARQGVVVPVEDTQSFVSGVLLSETATLLPPMVSAQLEHAISVLSQLGLHTCGDIHRLGRSALISRFGDQGRILADLVDGRDVRVAAGRRVLGSVQVVRDFDPPALYVDQVILEVRGLCQQLADQLSRGGHQASRLNISMHTAGHVSRERTWGGVDCTNPEEIVDRTRWQLRAWMDRADAPNAPDGPDGPDAPDQGLAHISIEACDLSTGLADQPLWGRGKAQQGAQRSADRVQSLLGEDQVLTPLIQGGFDPRSQTVCVPWGNPTPDLVPRDGEWEGSVQPAPAAVLDQPVGVRLSDGHMPNAPITVDRRGHLSGHPRHLQVPRSPGVPGCERDQTLTISVVSGPWPVRGAWWSGAKTARVYLRVNTQMGDLLLVYREGGWWIEGMF